MYIRNLVPDLRNSSVLNMERATGQKTPANIPRDLRTGSGLAPSRSCLLRLRDSAHTSARRPIRGVDSSISLSLGLDACTLPRLIPVGRSHASRFNSDNLFTSLHSISRTNNFLCWQIFVCFSPANQLTKTRDRDQSDALCTLSTRPKSV